MAHCFIISKDTDFLKRTKGHVKKHGYFKPVKIKLDKDNIYTNAIDLHKRLSEKFSTIPFADLRGSVVLVDEYFILQKCKPIEHNVCSNVFWGRMILTFPELEFIFLNKTVKDSRNIIDWKENETQIEETTTANGQHQIKKKTPFLSLFDFSGLRSAIQQNINKTSGNTDQNNIIERKLIARVIEDEDSYAYFHGYIAYKRQHLCKLYTTLNHLVQGNLETDKVDLQIQDLSLGFVDKREDYHLKSLSERYKKFPFLQNVKDVQRDFAITVGEEYEQVDAKYINLDHPRKPYKIIGKPTGENSLLLKKKKNPHYRFTVGHTSDDECPLCKSGTHELPFEVGLILKPTKGMYDIESMLRLNPGCNDNSTQPAYQGHSAPGILAMIAEDMIVRAQRILDNAKRVTDAIHAALLALEAKELLNGLTPTLALQAFALQQKAEVTAECLFVGTEYNIDLELRFRDIKDEVVFISKRFAESEQQRVQLNTQLSIVEILSGVYGNYKQFEEEIECLNQARKLHLSLLRRGNWRYKVSSVILCPVDKLVAKPWQFLVFIIFIQFFFGLLYFSVAKYSSGEWLTTSFRWEDWVRDVRLYGKCTAEAVKFFFTSETGNDFDIIFNATEPYILNLLLALQGFLSLTSITIAMALLITYLNRK